MMPNLKLGSCDGEIIIVESEIAKQSLTIRDMLNILGMDDMCGEIVPIPNVTAAILRKVYYRRRRKFGFLIKRL